MPIESSASFIPDLVEANPTGADERSTADDHLRLIKRVVKDTLPNLNAAMTASSSELNSHEGRIAALETAKFAKDGSVAATGDFDLGNHRLKNVAAPTLPSDAPNVAWVQNYVEGIFNLIYPVGHIYISSVNTNPAALFGVGTWEIYGPGRMIMCAGTSTDTAGNEVGFAAGSTGGEYFHTLTQAELPNVPLQFVVGSSAGGSGSIALDWSGGQNRNTTALGSGQKHYNIPPYIVAYVWRRTA